MPNFNLLKELFLPDKHWGFWQRGLSWSILGWITRSIHHSSNFARGAEPWEQDKQGLCTVTATPEAVFPSKGCLNSCWEGGPGCLWQQEVEGRWEMCECVQRHQRVLLQLRALVTQICRETKQGEIQIKNEKMVQGDLCGLLPTHP